MAQTKKQTRKRSLKRGAKLDAVKPLFGKCVTGSHFHEGKIVTVASPPPSTP